MMAAGADPLRLLFVTTYTGMGGGESLQLNLFRAFDRRRYAPTLLTPAGGPFPDAAAAGGVPTRQIPYRGAPTLFVPALWAHAPVVGRLSRCIRLEGARAVISDYHSLPRIVPAARRAGVPVIWLAMGWWFPVRPWQRRFFSHDVARVIAISSAVRDRLLGQPPAIEPGRVDVIVPGVDVDHWHPGAADEPAAALRARLGLDAGTPLVAMVARFQDVKGHDTFLEMARRVLARRPDVRFAVAGENVFGVSKDETYKQRILRTVADDPLLRARVSYLGFLPDARSLIAAADLIVCSSWFESLSMVALEAMAMGRPIVSTNVGGPAETLVHDVTGLLVPPRDADRLADAVSMLLDDAGRRVAMGREGRRHVVSHFSAARYAEVLGAAVRAVVDASA